jgi:SpoVK/Ycf46/Vps4 family AAA+-type ATPase
VCCIWIRPEHLLISPSGIEGDASAGIASVPQRLVRLFRTASRIQPCVVVIESIEDIFASPSSSSSSTNISKQDKRSRMEIQVTISNLLKSYPHVILIGISSRMHMLTYTSLGIFSEHIALSLPDASQRAIALKYHLSNSSSTINSTTTTDNIREKARSCHAFVLRDMEFVAKEVKHGKKSLDDAICNIKSSLLSPSFSVSVPNVSWNVVGGVNEAKRALEEAVIWPTTRSEDLKRMGVKPPRGILLVGPPGVGKTLLAKAVATASKSHFLTASVSSLVDAASGESAAKIRDLFSVARQCAPSVVFLDEFQALFGMLLLLLLPRFSVCPCVCVRLSLSLFLHTHTHTHRYERWRIITLQTTHLTTFNGI